MVVVDDHGREAVGCCGNPMVSTPNRSKYVVISATPVDLMGAAFNPSSGGPARQVQRRLKAPEIDELLTAYLAGDPVRAIVRFGVSRTTVKSQVTRR